MTVSTWTSLGGWYAAAIATYLAGVLLFTKPTYTSENSRNRQAMLNLVVLFGWIPVGIALLVFRYLWNSLTMP